MKNRYSGFWISLFLVSFFILIKFPLLSYGMPHLFHPDEPYLLKDPFKIIDSYGRFSFSSPMNLFFWISLVWYFVIFLIGLVFNEWNSFEAFINLVIEENFFIIQMGRLLSLIFSGIGSLFLFKLVAKIIKEPPLKLLIGLTLLLNPIEIISNLWIKFDPICYCFFSILLFYSYEYFIQKDFSIRNRLYFLGIVGLTIRIDFISFLAAIGISDILIFYLNGNVRYYSKKLFSSLIWGGAFYLLITMLPIYIIFNYFNTNIESENLGLSDTFEVLIFKKMYKSFADGSILASLTNNLNFYFINCFSVILGPGCIVLFTLLLFRFKRFFFYIILFLLFLIPILIFSYSAPHYFLNLSIIVLVGSTLIISEIENSLLKYLIASFNLVFIGSLGIYLLWILNTQSDTRIQAREFILSNSLSEDLIAIEHYQNPGFFPPIYECPDVLLEKSNVTRQLGLGTGKSFAAKAKISDNFSCRKVLEISAPDRFEHSEYAGIWINPFDPELFEKVKPKYFSSLINYNILSHGKFSNYINDNYPLEKRFKFDYLDPRVNFFIDRENFFTEIFIYKRKISNKF